MTAGPDAGVRLVVLRAERVVRRHERVSGAGVHRERRVDAERLQRGLEFARRVRSEEVVVFGHVAADHGGDLRVVGLVVALREAVERHDRLDLVGPRARRGRS